MKYTPIDSFKCEALIFELLEPRLLSIKAWGRTGRIETLRLHTMDLATLDFEHSETSSIMIPDFLVIRPHIIGWKPVFAELEDQVIRLKVYRDQESANILTLDLSKLTAHRNRKSAMAILPGVVLAASEKPCETT